MKKYNIAVLGATGNVGSEILAVLEERKFPIGTLYALASENSQGTILEGGDQSLEVLSAQDFDYTKVDIVLASAGSFVSENLIPKIAKKGAIVIDNSSYFRSDPDVPLIISEINLSDLKNYSKKNIIANPNCSTIGMLMALAPLHKINQIKRIVVSTYQSVSGSGREYANELFEQTRDIYSGVNVDLSKTLYPRQIAFNVIPHIDVIMDDGNTKEEWKMNFETQKILDPNIKVSATCVRVPVFVGHSMSVNVEFSNKITKEEVVSILKNSKGVIVEDEYTTPVEIAGKDDVSVSRIREDKTQKNTINMWIVSDNILKGAALNTVQIAEELIKQLK